MPISSDGFRWRHNMTMYSNPPVLKSSILAVLFILCSTIPLVAALDGLDGLGAGVPLSIDICTRSQTYRQSVQLPCSVAKNSNSVIAWLKDGQKLDFKDSQGAGLSKDGTLELLTPEKMLGLYQCVVTQHDGRVIMSNVTRVYSTEFIIPSTRRITTSRQIDEGKPVLLKCLNEADVVYNEGSYTCVWKINNIEIDLTHSDKYQQATDGSLIILYSEESDAGEYTCDLTYSDCYGNKKSITRLKYSLNVRPSTAVLNPVQPLHAFNTPTPYTVVEGQPFTLQCVFGGRRNGATASISWYDPAHQIIAQGSNQINVARASRLEHDGKFRCEGKFPGSALSSAIEIDVKVEAPVDVCKFKPPKISGSLKDLTVPVTESVILRCPATGRPEPETSWFINGSAVLSSSSSVLVDKTEGILTLLGVEFVTSVSCRMFNKHGHQVSNALITPGSEAYIDLAVKVSSSSLSPSSTTATTTTATTTTTTTSPAPSASLSFNPTSLPFSSKTDLPSGAKVPTSPSLKPYASSSSSITTSSTSASSTTSLSPASSSQQPIIKPDPPKTPGLQSPSTGNSRGESTLSDGPLRDKEQKDTATVKTSPNTSDNNMHIIVIVIVVCFLFALVVVSAIIIGIFVYRKMSTGYQVTEDKKRKKALLTGYASTEDNGRSQAVDHAPGPIYRQPQVNVVTPIRTIITTEDELNNYKQNDLNEKKQLNVESMPFKFNDFGQNLNLGPQKDKLSYSHSF